MTTLKIGFHSLQARLQSLFPSEPDVCDDAAAEVALCAAEAPMAAESTSNSPLCQECGSAVGVSLYEPLPPDTGAAIPLCADCWNDYYQQCLSDQAYREDRHEVTR